MDKDQEQQYHALRLENQLCFPLYAASRQVIRRYRPYLDALNLTYTQYIAMMVFWTEKQVNVKDLGEKLYLDSGTLSPMLKSLESKGYITRRRAETDERVVLAEVTDAGMALRERALSVPGSVGACIKLDGGEALTLYELLWKLLNTLQE